MRHFLLIFLLIGSSLAFTGEVIASLNLVTAVENEEVRLDRTKVRYGNVGKFDPAQNHKVALVRSSEVYEATPAGKIIKKEGLEKGSARYNELIRQASATYKAALKKVAKSSAYVLIVEQGGISGYANVTDATATIIAAI